MAIVQEQMTIGGKTFVKTYSDEYRYVVRDGVEYAEAVDPAEFNREYTEGEIMEEYAAEADMDDILAILLEGRK